MFFKVGTIYKHATPLRVDLGNDEPLFSQTLLLFFFLLFYIVTTMAQNLTRYRTAPPKNATIMYDRKTLNELAKNYPCGLLHDENGGYYLKDGEDRIIGVASDGLCTELDAAYAEAEAERNRIARNRALGK
ncbi:hypothetical protein BJX64DRAFT_271970 [Aspergillus heterothallicus]